VSDLADLLGRLDTAVAQAVTSGEVGTARSLRFHVGGPTGDLPSPEHLLALGDALFDCPRLRQAESGSALLCVWEGGQVATVSSSPAPRLVVILTLLGSGGALHLSEQER
jgi:hypothetical protein